MSSVSWPVISSWKDPVANAAALPASGNTDGDARVDVSTDTIYLWHDAGSNWLAVATPGAAIALDGLNGDVSASGPGVVSATVNSVGGSSAANVHSAELLANAATNANTASAIVKRDASGDFSAGKITASTYLSSTTNIKLGKTAYATISGTGNTLVGDNAGTSITSGIGNVALGLNAAPSVVSGAYGIFLGALAGQIATSSGPANIGIGYQAMYMVGVGQTNIGIGYAAGSQVDSGSNNIAIGTSSGLVAPGTASNTICIGNAVTVSTANHAIIGNSSNRVGLCGITPSAYLTLPAVSTTAGTSSLKITAGTVMTTPEQGAIESDGTHLYWTNSGGTRVDLASGGGSGADQALSNLTSPTAINQILTGDGVINLQLATPNATGANSKLITALTGTANDSGFSSGGISLTSGASDDRTGSINLSTGQSANSKSGDVNLFTGDNNVTASVNNTGTVNIWSGYINDSGSSGSGGDVAIFTGDNAGTGSSGEVTLNSGASTGGASGNIVIGTGAGVTRGSIDLDASKVNLFSKMEFDPAYTPSFWGSPGYSLLLNTDSVPDDGTQISVFGSTDSTTSAATPSVLIASGASSLGSTNVSTGEVDLQTGYITGTGVTGGTSGGININTGNATGSANSGYIILQSGSTVDGNTGNLTIGTGIPGGGGSRGSATISASSIVLDGPTKVSNSIQIPEISTPSNPEANTDKAYFKSDGQLYELDSSGTEFPVGNGWVKFTAHYTDFAVASTNHSFVAGALPPHCYVSNIIIKHSVAFTGGAISAVTAQGKYTSASLGTLVQSDGLDVFQSPSDTAVGQSAFPYTIATYGSAANVSIAIDSVGANLDQLTQGTVIVAYQISRLVLP
jgi:hypothetical protein